MLVTATSLTGTTPCWGKIRTRICCGWTRGWRWGGITPRRVPRGARAARRLWSGPASGPRDLPAGPPRMRPPSALSRECKKKVSFGRATLEIFSSCALILIVSRVIAMPPPRPTSATPARSTRKVGRTKVPIREPTCESVEMSCRSRVGTTCFDTSFPSQSGKCASIRVYLLTD